MNNFTYGKCPKCGAYLTPILFAEEEYIGGIATGRKRWIITHLQCEECDYKAIPSENYDGQWFV